MQLLQNLYTIVRIVYPSVGTVNFTIPIVNGMVGGAGLTIGGAVPTVAEMVSGVVPTVDCVAGTVDDTVPTSVMHARREQSGKVVELGGHKPKRSLV
jgi:hypothetical protein